MICDPRQDDLDRLANSTGAMLTLKDLAQRLSLGESTAWRLLAQGKLPDPDLRIGKRIIRWRPSTIEQFIESGGIKTK